MGKKKKIENKIRISNHWYNVGFGRGVLRKTPNPGGPYPNDIDRMYFPNGLAKRRFRKGYHSGLALNGRLREDARSVEEAFDIEIKGVTSPVVQGEDITDDYHQVRDLPDGWYEFYIPDGDPDAPYIARVNGTSVYLPSDRTGYSHFRDALYEGRITLLEPTSSSQGLRTIAISLTPLKEVVENAGDPEDSISLTQYGPIRPIEVLGALSVATHMVQSSLERG